MPALPQVHHLDGTGETEEPNHVPENLVTLCKPCHRNAHHFFYRVTNGTLVLHGLAFTLLGWGEEIAVPLEAIRKSA